MSQSLGRRVFKTVLGLTWLGLLITLAVWMDQTHTSLRHLPRVLQHFVRSFGYWGPFALLAVFVVRTVLFIPSTALVLMSGSIFGPVWGMVLSLLGENLSAAAGFWLGRWFGRSLVQEHEHGWVKRYDELLTKEGFMTILIMRLLFFPFDVVNYGSGMTGIGYRPYAVATLLGMLPSLITLSVLGDALGNPRAFLLFCILLVITVLGVFLLQRSKWVRQKLTKTPLPPTSHG